MVVKWGKGGEGKRRSCVTDQNSSKFTEPERSVSNILVLGEYGFGIESVFLGLARRRT